MRSAWGVLVRATGLLLGWVVVAAVVAGLLVLTLPRQLGLSMVTPIGQVVAFRGLLLALTIGALLVAVGLWTTSLLRARRRRRVGGRTGAGLAMVSVLVVALVASAAVHTAVLLGRGFDPAARVTPAQLATLPPSADEVTVVALNSQWDEVDPRWVADLVLAGQAQVLALPESEADHAEAVARELEAAGQPGWQVFASSSPWPNALLVSPRLGRYALVDRGNRGLVIAEPVGHDGPVVITVHAMPPPSVPPWHPDHRFLSLWWVRTVSEASDVIRGEASVIAAGDFNATLDHAALDPGIAPVTTGAEGWGTWPSTWPAWAGARIDHVYARSFAATGPGWVVDAPGSDHRAVVVRVRPA